MLELTVEMVSAATGARYDRAHEAFDGLVEAMRLYAIDTPTRAAYFLANVGHETAGLKYLEEIWGPTAQQLRYERDFTAPWPACVDQAKLPAYQRNRLAWVLGNEKLGDGRLYAGHGYLQDTGRGNHARTRDRLRARFPTLAVPDFELEPLQLATRRWAAVSSADYIDRVGANVYADAGDFDAYCDAINLGRHTAAIGDANGYADRARLLAAVGGGKVFA